MPRHLLELLRDKNLTLATAESCTGGLIASMITSLPGASDTFDRGFVTYSNEAKIEALGVPTETIEQHGAVSPETARAMAEGTIAHSHATAAITTTGIAGPTGGTDEKPVGLVYIGYALNGETHVEKHIFNGSREDIQKQATQTAITNLSHMIKEQL